MTDVRDLGPREAPFTRKVCMQLVRIQQRFARSAFEQALFLEWIEDSLLVCVHEGAMAYH
jgi:hypothetical protein